MHIIFVLWFCTESDQDSHGPPPSEPEEMWDEMLSEEDMPDLRLLEDLQKPGSKEHAEFMKLDVSNGEAVQAMLDRYSDEQQKVQSEVVNMHSLTFY